MENYFVVAQNISDDTQHSADIHSDMLAGMVVLFKQYGNLFRDCDALEGRFFIKVYFFFALLPSTVTVYKLHRRFPLVQPSLNHF